jgi:hypothetical protein
MVTFVLMFVIWNTSLDRARRAASNGVIFESGTGTGSNISKKYFLKKFSPW